MTNHMTSEIIDTDLAKTDAEPPETVDDLVGEYDELKLDKGSLYGNDEYIFLKTDWEKDVALPVTLPTITHVDLPMRERSIYFMIPADIDLPRCWENSTSPLLTDDTVSEGKVFIPEDAPDLLIKDPIDHTKIIDAMLEYRSAVAEAKKIREAKELLWQEQLSYSQSQLIASVARIEQETPMLIEGLIRERGVSVFYGAFDEFKTTLVLDMVAHVAMGVPWQGRKVEPRPVIWYALEGKEEIPVRLKALEASFKGKDSVWGDFPVPVTALDRIPEDSADWRAEILRTMKQWEQVFEARETLNDFEMTWRNSVNQVADWKRDDIKGTIKKAASREEFHALAKDCREYIIYEDKLYEPNMQPVYPSQFSSEEGMLPVIVIDTLSLALGDDDEKGARAVGFINNCLDLLKERPDMGNPHDILSNEYNQWYVDNPDADCIDDPVASHVIIIHHQTKTGLDFAGHRAIAANTQALYRVHRFGKITDVERPYAGQLTPKRTKGIPRPAPIRFDVDVVPVEDTKQTAVILKTKAKAIPKKLKPIIKALRKVEDQKEITLADLNKCLDVAASNRATRQRYRIELEEAGVLEPVEDDNGKVASYHFHDISAA